MNSVQPGDAVNVGATGGWQSWQTVSTAAAQLSQGTQTLRVQVQSGGFTLSWIDIRMKPRPQKCQYRLSA
ncbi:carbohydrate-binding protein [Exilibacterium tricleocarpae]|uniref:Carbohydrate-binding protein n=1 Tax=Exilibacterium tricleocarpae TaxID=2591008 RepID=A0A545TND5_9GAMM|nr:carbohydrate-binding protein [Exilibacterium tricleocarpae]